MWNKGLGWVGIGCACVLIGTCLVEVYGARQVIEESPQQAPTRSPLPATTIPAQGDRDRGSIQDALLRPMDFPFGQGTTLKQVAEHLARESGGQVVIDRAALARLELDESAEVQLELKGIRLKTGLRLLLDQVDMTYRVEAEDNLLVLTDRLGAEDPMNRIVRELEELHLDLHEVKNRVSMLMELMIEPMQGDIRNPMMREELPVEGGEAPPRSAPIEKEERGRRG